MSAVKQPFRDFPSDFRGAVLRPSDSGFAEARRIHNMRWVNRNPALIAQAIDAADVATVLRYASAGDIPIAVRGGGHGADGTAMQVDAIVLDLSRMRDVKVDASTRRIRAQGGTLLGGLDAAAQAHGLVVPSGTVSTTGIAGLTLGGGVGHLMRRFGATVDNLVSCDVVTVDGRHVVASATENPDLFWALRGGGGNFGVVTTFEYQGHPLSGEVTTGFIVFEIDEAKTLLTKLNEYIRTAPRELGIIAAQVPCPPLPPIPSHLHGKLVMMLVTVYTGKVDDATSVLSALGTLAKSSASVITRAPWVQVNSMLDAIAPFGRRIHSRGGYFSELDAQAIDVVIDRGTKAPEAPPADPSTVLNVWFMGGAISEDAAEDSMAFSREGARAFWECVGQWNDATRDAEFAGWVDGTAEALAPVTRSNGYANLTTDRGATWRRGLFGKPAKYRKLMEAKAKWDPKNLLRFNKNIQPV